MKRVLFGLAIASLFAACKGSTATVTVGADSTAAKIEKNKQTAMKTEISLNKGDIDGVYKYCSADFVDYGNGNMPAVKNIDSLKANFKSLLTAFPDFKGEDLVAVGDSNTVIVTGTWSGTFKKDFMHMKATNASFKVFDADIFTFNPKGEMTSHRSIQSDATFFAQLGIPIPPKKK